MGSGGRARVRAGSSGFERHQLHLLLPAFKPVILITWSISTYLLPLPTYSYLFSCIFIPIFNIFRHIFINLYLFLLIFYIYTYLPRPGGRGLGITQSES